MRLFIAIFLLSIFACQALPVAALGKSWVKQKISVSDNAGDDCDDDIPENGGKIKKQESKAEDAFIQAGSTYEYYSFVATRQIMLHGKEHLPVLYAGEIDSPPPDFY